MVTCFELYKNLWQGALLCLPTSKSKVKFKENDIAYYFVDKMLNLKLILFLVYVAAGMLNY